MAKDDDVSIFDELDDKLDNFFAEDDDLFAEEDDLFAKDDDLFADEGETDTTETKMDEPSDQIEEAVGEQKKDTDSTAEPEVANNVDSISSNIDAENPLERLKAIVLEMDWEISEENLNNYLTEINSLIKNYQNDRPIYLFFKLHAAIGNYMLTKKARAHPEALKFLYRVYESLEMALASGVPLVEKNKMILKEVNNFKLLKKKLFPGFYPEESVSDQTADTKEDEDQFSEDEDFDISSLPEDVQKGINKYIEKIIAEKIESISNKSSK